jgi:hypothetical protein
MRTTYTGPVKNRGENARGQANVFREELEDFRRQYGRDKTLRDLLNADRTGKLPASEKSPMARGPQEANVAPRRAEIPGAPANRPEPSAPSKMERVGSGLSDTAKKVLAATGATAAAGGLGYGLYRAKKARDAAEALRRLDEPAMEAAQRAGAERRAMSTLKEGLAKDLAQDISSGSIGRGTPMRSTAATSETGRRFTPAQEMEAATSAVRGAASRKAVQEARTGRSQAAAEAKAERPILRKERAKESPRSRTRDEEDVEFRKGGKVKTYASGGSVKGSGCEQRGLRKCKVY